MILTDFCITKSGNEASSITYTIESCYCVFDNKTSRDNGDSPWYKKNITKIGNTNLANMYSDLYTLAKANFTTTVDIHET